MHAFGLSAAGCGSPTMWPKVFLNQPFPEKRSRWRHPSEMLKEIMAFDTIIRGGTIATASRRQDHGAWCRSRQRQGDR
jgi:hypothetical protein